MELVSIVTFKVLGSCYISIKANLSKAVIAICSFNEPIRIPGTNAADNSKKTFSSVSPLLVNSILRCSLCSLFWLHKF